MRSALATQADPEKAPRMQRYMKSAMPYLGLQSPALRRVCREVFGSLLLNDAEAWQAAVRELWYGAEYREERYAALELLADRRYAQWRTLDALPLYEELIVSGAWWDLVDGIATREVGDLLRREPRAMRAVLLRWSTSDDHWLRRTSIIAQVGFKRATDENLLFACIAPSLGERDFFLRKAIGWALREYAKVEPSAVRQYVTAHESALSGLSRREALKHIQAPGARR